MMRPRPAPVVLGAVPLATMGAKGCGSTTTLSTPVRTIPTVAAATAASAATAPATAAAYDGGVGRSRRIHDRGINAGIRSKHLASERDASEGKLTSGRGQISSPP